VPTEFLVANDSQQQPGVSVWDLRNPAYPVASLSSMHSSGVLSASWSNLHPSLLVSCGQDGRTIVTDRDDQTTLQEFPGEGDFGVLRWAPMQGDKVAAMDAKGNTTILSVTPEGRFSNPDAQYNAPLIPFPSQTADKAPKGGFHWGFGNKLASFQGTQITVSH